MEATVDVFVSYRRIDVEFVKRVVKQLDVDGKTLWVDWEDIPPGVESFSKEIRRGIERANTFLAVLSPEYVLSPYCRAELDYAAELNKRIIPIIIHKIDDFVIPSVVQEINWVYFVPHAGLENDFQSAYSNLIKAIDADYAHIQEHTRLFQLASDWQTARQNRSFLLSGEALTSAETWLAQASRKEPKPNTLHTEFIVTSRRVQSQRRRNLLVGSSLLLFITLIALVIAVQQFFESTRRAQEITSLLIANEALTALALGDTATAISRAYHASTLISNPPSGIYGILREVAFRPAPRHIIPTPDIDTSQLPQLASVGERITIDDTAYLQQDSPTAISLRSSDGMLQTQFRTVTIESRDDTLIHPDVMARIREVQNNSLGPIGVGYDISPDGTLVAMGGEAIGLTIWTNNEDAPVYARYDDHTLIVDSVKFSDNGHFLISAASERQLVNFGRTEVEYFIRDVQSGAVVQQLTTLDQLSEWIAISESGRSLMFYDYEDNSLAIWDTEDGIEEWRRTSLGFSEDLTFTEDSQYLIASSVLTQRMAPAADIRVLDVATGDLVRDFDGLDSNRIVRLPNLLGSTPNSLYVIEDDQSLVLLNIETGDTQALGTLPVSPSIIGTSVSGRYIAYEDFDTSELVVYDLQENSELGRMPYLDFVRAAAISPDGSTLAYISEAPDTGLARLIVHEVQTTSEIAYFEDARSTFSSNALLFTKTGLLIYQDQANSIQVVDVETWQNQTSLSGFLDEVHDLSFSGIQQYLAAAGMNGSVTVWDIETGATVYQTTDGNHLTVALSPDSDLLATADENGLVIVRRLFNDEETIAWVEDNRAILPLSCADRIRYQLGRC